MSLFKTYIVFYLQPDFVALLTACTVPIGLIEVDEKMIISYKYILRHTFVTSTRSLLA